jgi:hypothetical protein
MMAVGQDRMVDSSGTTRNYTADAASRARIEGGESRTLRYAASAPRADHYERGMRDILSVRRGDKPSGVSHEEILRGIQVCASIE